MYAHLFCEVAATGAFMLVDEKGRRYFIPERAGAVRVRGLGVVDAAKLSTAGVGSLIEVAGKSFRLFRPTLSDMMRSIERGPQIVTEKDAALIMHFMDVTCGSTVLELGAGSGSMTIALLRNVGDTGLVVSYDNRLGHLSIANSNVRKFGMERCWFPVLGDVRRHLGSAFADSVFMDVPDPWKALDSCWSALRPGGVLASYSPTVNQIENFEVNAREMPFMHEITFEVIVRKLETSPGATRHSFEGPGHTGYISVFRKTNGDKYG